MVTVTVKIMSLYLVILLVLAYVAWIKWIYYQHRRSSVNLLKHVMNISSDGETDVRALVVTAHPDDECMFFAPTIIRLVESNATVHLLCLSEGNYYNQGAQRRRELLSSCAVLGIPASRVTIINHRNLPDDPSAEWSVSLTSSAVVKYVSSHSINMVLTFDGRGVSGHANHVAIHKAVRHLASTGEVPKDCVLLSLVTVGLFRKYISFLELPLSWLLPSHLCCVIGTQGYKRAKDAMMCHRSQLLWFRYLYIAFSRYMFINTFQLIPQELKSLKFY
ncbi:N-acetylglucosaminyl-phosphatidylinositol de-N-acetylase [Austrofundulus limnaeus]|uniref:N-acetylglucosaminylphosphatidylinositol deacetylase n=1 Tax=Austrofundulus limnaeus TaxID=52670 RepID=A0A2I4C536_AUSLI|nr:PREDICTED: N-acetylglucosaminyl-phosphatidylinositol de-N-acetylase [Austrofundulus limnaeus]